MRGLCEKQSRASLEKIVEARVPKAPPLPNELKEAAMLARARTAVIESGDWLTAAQLADMAQFSSSKPSAQPNKWKRDGAIFAIGHHGIDYFPSYSFDPHTGIARTKRVIVRLSVRQGRWGPGITGNAASARSVTRPARRSRPCMAAQAVLP